MTPSVQWMLLKQHSFQKKKIKKVFTYKDKFSLAAFSFDAQIKKLRIKRILFSWHLYLCKV